MEDVYNSIGIYRITNIKNGMSYIGKTGMNFGDRWSNHKSLLNSGKHSNSHLQNAWNKYGESMFEFAVVESVTDPAVLNELEIKYISEYKSAGISYNIHDGGDGGCNSGRHLSEETKRKIGEKNRINMLGRKASNDTKLKMSESQKRRYSSWTDDDRARHGSIVSEKSRGYHWSEESRKRFSELQRNNPNRAKFTPDDIRAIRRKKSEGSKLSELAIEYNTSESYISNIVHRRRWADVE